MNPSISSLGKMAQTQNVQPKSGQVIKGKVLELTPGNRAVVQVGKQQVHAQLETSLTKGKSYVFQVMGTEEGMMSLKVVSQAKGMAQSHDVQQLLQGLGLKSTKLNMDFLQTLLKTDTAFQTADLKQALALLQQADQKPIAKDILMVMMQKQYPIKNSVFQALFAKKTTELTQLMQQLQPSHPPQTLTDQKVQDLIANLKGSPPVVSSSESSAAKVLTEVMTNNQTSFKLFQKAGLVDSRTTFNQFQQTWNQWVSQGESSMVGETSLELRNPSMNTPKQMLQVLSASHQSAQSPMPASMEQMGLAMKNLFDQQLPMTKSEQQALVRWTAQLAKLVQSQTGQENALPLSETSRQKWASDHQLLVQKQSFQKLLPLIPETGRTRFEQLTGQLSKVLEQRTPPVTQGMREVTEVLQRIQSNQLTHTEKASLTEWVSRLASDFSPTTKDSILLKLKAMVDLSGVQDEAVIKQQSTSDDVQPKESSLKSSLLQSLQDPQSQIRPETARQMISLLNGIQLSAHQETNQSIQMAIQFPGDIIGATSDIQMNMEGRRTKEGEIDPDYCHIVFFLHLENFEDTVVDLNIVDRRVGVTVYNHHDVDQVVEEFKPMLDDGLKQLGYQLSSLQSKPIEEEISASSTTSIPNREEGVDIRI